jgi:hypothetical protein
MPGPRRGSEDENLAPLNYRELNRAFYVASPTDYFGHRLGHLILRAGRSEDLDRLAGEGVSYRGLKIGGAVEGAPADQSGGKSAEELAKEAERFVVAEAEVLSHHVGETLLRLYLAHAHSDDQPPPACPWLEVSRLRSFSKAKEIVAARFGSDVDPEDAANRRAVARVFHLIDDPAKVADAGIPQDRWDTNLATIESYLRGFAGQFLEKAALYNSAKHGLALLPGEGSMRWDDGSLIRAEGPMVQYLKVRDGGERRRWSHVLHWSKPDRQMTLVYRACQLIDRLWDTARIRYLPEQRPERIQIHLFGGPTWHDLMLSSSEDTGGIVVEEMAMDLLYYVTPEEAAAEAATEAEEAPPEEELGPEAPTEAEDDEAAE